MRALASALALAFAGCAATNEAARVPIPERDLGVVVAPLNLALRLPDELEESADRVWPVLLARAVERTRKLAILEASDAWELWKGVLMEAQIRGKPDLRTVLREFALDVGQQAEFDLLLVPSLVYREAPFDGTTARWDGVRRRIRRRHDAKQPDSEWAFEGRITGVSLHLLAFGPYGEQRAQCWGGLDLAHEFELDGTQHVLVPLAKPLSNPAFLREGIDLALEACLGER